LAAGLRLGAAFLVAVFACSAMIQLLHCGKDVGFPTSSELQ
jgi:hypothetical protein